MYRDSIVSLYVQLCVCKKTKVAYVVMLRWCACPRPRRSRPHDSRLASCSSSASGAECSRITRQRHTERTVHSAQTVGRALRPCKVVWLLYSCMPDPIGLAVAPGCVALRAPAPLLCPFQSCDLCACALRSHVSARSFIPSFNVVEGASSHAKADAASGVYAALRHLTVTGSEV